MYGDNRDDKAFAIYLSYVYVRTRRNIYTMSPSSS